MDSVHTNGIDLTYQIDGDGEPLVLIMGLGGQLTDWPLGLVERLAKHFMVIRFDNRDSGLSTTVDAPAPTRWELIKGNLRPSTISTSYTLADMADDTAGLLDELDVSSAHFVGMSMGGMIAQLVALQHRAKVRTLCSIMSNTGDRRHGQPTARVLSSLARRGQPSRSDALGVTLDLFRLVGGPDWDETEQRQRSTISLERSYDPARVLRQTQAIAASADRTARLATITQPTLVLHGLHDPLIRPSGGIATARAIPGSRLLMFPGMGHDLPATRHDEIVQAIRLNCKRDS